MTAPTQREPEQRGITKSRSEVIEEMVPQWETGMDEIVHALTKCAAHFCGHARREHKDSCGCLHSGCECDTFIGEDSARINDGWGRPEPGTRRDIVGVRDLSDGRKEYLMHNEALCHPYYLAVSAPAATQREEASKPRPSENPWWELELNTECTRCHSAYGAHGLISSTCPDGQGYFEREEASREDHNPELDGDDPASTYIADRSLIGVKPASREQMRDSNEERFLHELSAVTVMLRAIRSNLWEHRPRQRRVRETVLWDAVSSQFSLGSTYSKDLCRKAGIDPDLRAWTWRKS